MNHYTFLMIISHSINGFTILIVQISLHQVVLYDSLKWLKIGLTDEVE